MLKFDRRLFANDAAVAQGGNPNPTIVESAQPPQLPNGNGGNPPANGFTVPEWAKSFDPEAQEVVKKKQWQKPDEAIRAYSHLEKLAHRDGDRVFVPNLETPDTERAEFYQKLGWPEKPDGYQFKAPEEAADYSTELADWFRSAAHKHFIPKEAAEALHDEFVGRFLEKNKELAATETQTRAEWDKSLHREFGKAYDERVEIARRAVRTFGDDDLIRVLNDSGLGDHPAVVKAFVKAGMKLGEQRLVTGEEGGRGGLTPAEAQEKIMTIRNDPKHPYNRADASDHGKAVEMMASLYQQAYPSQQ